MDIISHALVGTLFSERNQSKEKLHHAFWGALPDIFQIPLYMFLGHKNSRLFWFPLSEDWIGVRGTYSSWVLFWEIPHSVLFVLVVVLPVVRKFDLPISVIWAYLSHLLLDILSHTGEWSVKPLFPLDVAVEGFTDAWSWRPIFFPLSWLIIVLIWIIIRR